MPAAKSPAYELATCVVCGGTASQEIAGADAIRAEVEQLWEFHAKRLEPATPPRFLTDRVAFSQRPPLRVVRCAECGLVYRNPRESALELREIYGDEALDPTDLGRLLEAQRASYTGQAERLTEVVGHTGHVLEVGSYVGAFLGAAAERGWTAEGLDVNEAANDFTRSLGFRVHLGELTTFETAHRYDAVAIWNCFDQLAEPRQAASSARRLLRDGGVLAVRVPNGAFYAAVRARLDGPAAPVARALLAHNNLLSFPYRHGFTPSSLARLLDAVGFDVERIYGDTLVPIADEWTRGWAALEERMLKGALRLLSRLEAERAPWIEVYGRVKR